MLSVVRVRIAELLRRKPSLADPNHPAKASFCALLIRCYCTEMLTASNSMKTMNSCHVRRNTICSGFNAPLIRPRPALKLLTVLNQQEGRVPSNSQRPLVSCQRSRLSQTRKTMHTPEVCFEPEVQKPVPAWQRLASFLLKSTAMVALALALTFGGVSSAEAARSGGRMGGSSFSAARSGGGSYSSGSSSRSYGGSIGGGSSSRSYGGSTGGLSSSKSYTSPSSSSSKSSSSSSSTGSASSGFSAKPSHRSSASSATPSPSTASAGSSFFSKALSPSTGSSSASASPARSHSSTSPASSLLSSRSSSFSKPSSSTDSAGSSSTISLSAMLRSLAARNSSSRRNSSANPSSASPSSASSTSAAARPTPPSSSDLAASYNTGYGSFLGPGLAGGYGYGYGGGFGGPVVQRSDGGSGFITILVVVAALFIASQVASNVFGNGDDGDSGSGRSTVCKLQVGLLGSARSLQRDLERIAGRADTNTPDGLHYVLQETVLSLLRNPDYCVYGDGGTKNPRGLDGAEDAFNEVVLQERGKFKEETLVNVGGRSKRSSLKSRGDGMSELIVVTLIVAAEGGVKVPKVTSREDLTKALNKLGALRSEQILAVEVMWTPQAEDDYYTRDELFLDYPTLNTL